MDLPTLLIPLGIAVALLSLSAILMGPRIIGLLTLRYLRKRRIAWVSLIAVTLCTAMVIVVISVMGGWLRMFRQSFHGLSGDVIVRGDLAGFPHYEEIIRRAKELPEVTGAVPVVRTFGLININNRHRQGVEVVGFPPDIGSVNEFPSSLFLQSEDHTRPATQPSFNLLEVIPDSSAATRPARARPGEPDPLYRVFLPQSYRGDLSDWGGMIVGSGVVGLRKGATADARIDKGLYRAWVRLTVVPIGTGPLQLTDKRDGLFFIVDDSRTRTYLPDSNNVYVDFSRLQALLDMEGQPAANDNPGRDARCHEIQIAAKPGTDLFALRNKISRIADAVTAQRGMDSRFGYSVETWEERYSTFISAVEKEKFLVTILFGIISIVSVFLIFCIFYMIVVEKTRDIGIIKAVGASDLSVAGIFLGYGLAIGTIGGFGGLLCGYLIVHNINFLHERLAQLFHVYVWDPSVYMFDTIPNTMIPTEVTIIVAVAILSAVLGALIPAWRAARMHPVESLRWE